MSGLNWPLAQVERALTSVLKPDHASPQATGAVEFIVTDSRQVKPGDVFVCLVGERFDAHDFAAQVVSQGAVGLVVSRPLDLPVPQWVVTDTRAALGTLAHAWRKQFDIPVLGVVGSNGKTTSKEMLASICKVKWGADHVLVTEGNLNNEIGVPLTLLRLRAHHQAAVVEMGMNHVGEIEQLARWVHPTAVLMTNAQREHQEFMKDVESVALENGQAFRHLQQGGVAVFPAYTPYTALWQGLAGDRLCVQFGQGADAWVQPASPVEGDLNVSLELHTKNQQKCAFTARFLGQHNQSNAAAAAATGMAVGCTLQQAALGLSQFVPVKGRMNPVLQSAQLWVIDDSYNANPDSVNAASAVLSALPGHRVMVLGDMGEVGDQSAQFHAEVGHFAKTSGVQRMFTLGEATAHTAGAFGEGGVHFDNINNLIEHVKTILINSGPTVLLIKGSRFMKMERVVEAVLAWANTNKQESTHAS